MAILKYGVSPESIIVEKTAMSEQPLCPCCKKFPCVKTKTEGRSNDKKEGETHGKKRNSSPSHDSD